ncbi:MAG: protein translocase subunit SecD [Ignavibacteriales bacterium CG12_big_fil_rev_8_21_14_0_65_30_8]|nr:MAG: protein translocase subunit SecD [Ignavibacteriales bacterium CG12_big_fil_rev_8_21_14_0_65_30_8]
MKEFRFKIILILAAIGLSIYLLYPTYQNYTNNEKISKFVSNRQLELKDAQPNISKIELDKVEKFIEDSIKASDPNIAKTKAKSIKLGLDLQGGMRVVLEVNTGKLLEKLAKNPDDTFKKVIVEAEQETAISNESVVDIFARMMQARGIRLSRYYGSVRDEDSKIVSDLNTSAEDAVSRAMEIIRNRIDQYGVSEPTIQRQGSRRVIVELPGIAREEEAKQLLQGTALLQFNLVKDPQTTFNIMQRIDEVLAGKIDSTVDKTNKDSSITNNDSLANQQLSPEEFAKQHPFFSIALINPNSQTADAYVSEDQKDKLQLMLNRPEVKAAIPNNVEFHFSAKPFGQQDGKSIYVLYLVNKTPELTGGVITDAQATIDPSTSGAIVNMQMNSEGASDWARITGANIGKRIAIILDGAVYSAPNVINKIPSGNSQITGMANMEEAKLLEIVLKAGALPAPVSIIEERTVGPSLGEDSIRAGFKAAIIGFILVTIFMIFYYRRAGEIAAAALIFTVLFILGVLAGFGATLTLPGIAGIILTIGMAVDANVLIYERIREEVATGKTVKASVDSGFAKANSAIIDSNITTFLTGIILYQFGSGPVQGFALTLMIGIVASLFSALVIAKLIFNIMVAKGMKINLG